MTIKQHIPILSACTLTFLLFVFQLPTATSQEITFTEEPSDNYYIIKKRPVTISCAARHAVDISFTCVGVKVSPTEVEREAFLEDDPEVIKASITVTRGHVASYKKKEKYWCECNAIQIDGSVAATSKRGSVSNAVLKYRFKKQPTSQRVIDGESVEFVCEPPVSDPKPEIFWKKDNRRINMKADDRMVLSESGSLLIDSVVEDDVGSYSCVAKSPAGRRESKKADLDVAVLAESSEPEEESKEVFSSGAKSRESRETDKPFFSTEPKAVYYVKRDEEIAIHCGVTSANIITFRCNGVRTNRDKQTTSSGRDSDENTILQSQLSVLYSEVLDFHRKHGNTTAFQCQCVGWYQQKKAQKPQWMSILSNKNVGVVKLAYLETTFRREPSDVIVGENTRATLRCEPPKGQPSPWVYWFKDNVKIDPRSDTTYRVSREGNLVIPSADYSNTGRYKCVAENIVKQVESRVAELRVSATAPPPTTPTTTLATTGITVPENVGEDPVFLQDLPDETPINNQGVAKLTCMVYAATALSIDCNGRRLPEGEFKMERTTNQDTGKMILTVTTEVGAGDVRSNPNGYSCRCTGWTLGPGKKWQRLNGNRGLIVEKKKTFIGDTFIYPPKDLEVYFEDQTEIACEPPEGDPMPKVYWLKNGNKVKPELDSNFKVLPAGTLVLEFARVEDQGEYVCVAENEAGTRRSDPAKLTVKGGVVADDCMEEFNKCQALMSSAANSQDADIMCSAMDEVRQCILNLECPSEMKPHLDIFTKTLEESSEMCTSATSCKAGLQECSSMIASLVSNGDMMALCSNTDKLKKCLMDVICPEEMQANLQRYVDQVEKMAKQCEGKGATTPSGTDVTSDPYMDTTTMMDYESTTYDFYDDSTFYGDLDLEPFFTREPEPMSYIINNDDSVTLKCTVISAKSLFFACNGQVLQETGSTGFVTKDHGSDREIRDNSLIITAQEVEEYQGAEPYTCLCKGYFQREEGTDAEWFSIDSSPGVIQKAFLDRKFVQEPMSKQAGLGEMVTLMCVPPKGVPEPTVSWIHNGLYRSESDNIMINEDGSLVIKSFTEADEGKYTCSAENLLGKRTSESVDLTMGTSMVSTTKPDMTSDAQETTETPTVYTMPDMTKMRSTTESTTVTMRPYNGQPFFNKDLHSVYYVTKHDNIYIECEATGVDDVTMRCGKDGKKGRDYIGSIGTDEVLANGTKVHVFRVLAHVLVNKATLDYDKGTDYSCFCIGHYDYQGTRAFIESQEAFVEYSFLKRKFLKVPEDIITKEGQFLTLSCQPPNGNPPAEVSWLKDGEPVQRIVYPGGALALEEVTMEDAGEYKCVATNPAGRRKSSSFQVEVLPGQGMTTPDGVIGTGDGTDMGETTTDDSGLEVVEITSVPLTSDTKDEQSTMFNGFTTTDTMTSESTNEESTTYMDSMSTDDEMTFMKTSPTGKMSDTSEMSSKEMLDTSSSTTEEMSPNPTDSTADMVYSTGDVNMGGVTGDMMGKDVTTGSDMMGKDDTTRYDMMGKDDSTRYDTMGKDDTTHYDMMGKDETTHYDMMDKDESTHYDMMGKDETTHYDMMGKDESTSYDMMGKDESTSYDMTGNKDVTDPTMPMKKSTEDMYGGENQPTPEPSFPDESTTFEDIDEYKTCFEVIEKCRKSLPSGDSLDPEETCQGEDSYLKCVENFLNGCEGVVDEAVINSARNDYNMVKDKCAQYEKCPQLKQCRYIYTESSTFEEMESAKFPINLFCGDIERFMHCADATINQCGINMAKPTDDDVSSYSQISQWFEQYCQKFILDDNSIESCGAMADCNLPIDVAAKDNSTYWCRMVDSLHACTNNSVNMCGLSDLQDDLQMMSQMKSNLACSMEMPMKEGGGKGQMTKGPKDEGEAVTQATMEDCDGEECGAASIGVSVLLITVIQLVLAFFMTDQR